MAGDATPRGALRVATDGSADQVRELLDRLAGHEGRHRTASRSHRPTLDDVFLSVTGARRGPSHRQAPALTP